MRIDVHAHYYTEPLLQKMAEMGSPFIEGPRSAPNASVTLDERMDLLAAAGIDEQVLSPGGLQPYMTDVDRAVASAKIVNDAYAQAVQLNAGRLSAFGCVPLPHVDAALRELERCLDDLAFQGINLGCSIVSQPLDDPQFEPFWAELNRRQAVVFLHPLGATTNMLDAYALAWTVGGCFEDTVAAIRLVSSGLVDRFPNVKIIVPHLGGTLPFLWGRTSRPELRAGLKRLYYDSLNTAPGMLCAGCRILGPERVLLGTDFPWGPASLAQHISGVQQSGLTEPEVHGILDQHAAALLNRVEG